MCRPFLPLLILVGLLGCGGADQSQGLPATVPVTGQVTLDGAPIEGAVVTFVPTGKTMGIECVGRTDDTGMYTPKQTRGGEGVPPGTYTVVISRFLRDGKPVTSTAPGAGAMGVLPESLPPKYSDPTVTKLTATVPDEGGTIDFALESK